MPTYIYIYILRADLAESVSWPHFIVCHLPGDLNTPLVPLPPTGPSLTHPRRFWRTCLHIVSFMSNYWPAPGILKCLCVFMTEMCNW